MLRAFTSLLGAIGCLAAGTVAAGDVAVETVLVDLQRPCGVAIRPQASVGKYEVYVGDAAAGRVVKLSGRQAGTSSDAIRGFETSNKRDDAFRSPGPRGLLFLDDSRLVVTGRDKGGAFVRLYALPDEGVLPAAKYEQEVEPPPSDDGESLKPAVFHGVVRTRANANVADALVLSALGEPGSVAGIWKAPVRAGTLGELELFGSTEKEVEAALPAGVAVGSHGYVVMSGAYSKPNSGSITLKFLSPIDGLVALSVEIEIGPILGLAYSPRTGRLYAAVFGTGEFGKDGIYRIDDASERGKPAGKAVRIAEVSRPTALAFALDGTLYVTAWGEPAAGASESGSLVVLTGDL